MVSFLKRLFTSPFFIFLLLAYTYHTFQTYYSMGAGGAFESTPEVWLQIIYGYATFLSAWLILNGLTQKNRGLQLIANFLFLTVFCLLSGYLFGTEHSVDYSVLIETSKNALNKGTVEVVLTSFDPNPLIVGAVAFILFLGLEWRYKVISKRQNYPSKWPLLALALVYVAMIAGPIDSRDEFTHFIRTIYDYYGRPLYTPVPLKANEYPYYQTEFSYTPELTPPKEMPNVFIIVIESFNQWAVDQKTPQGQAIMPNFNELKKQGLYVDHFYGNSMLSIKGYSATLTGVLPTFRGFMLQYQDTDYYGLPQVFKENSYETIFFQAHLDPSFHGTEALVKRTGITHFDTIADYMTPEEATHTNNWGHRDHVLFRSFFRYLDQHFLNQPHPKPIFAAVVSIYSHMRFKVPESERAFYKDPQNQREHFSNCIHLVDQDLPVFFEELQKRPQLKNSIVIIIGDHSFPLGNHGITHAEVGYYDESFRVPFLMLWPGHLEPKEVQKTVYSQIDIAPTLVDLLHLNLNKGHQFIGRSLFAPPIERSTFLIQPYSGTYSSVVRYPYKYIFHHRTRKEYVFNLETDPEENNNLIEQDLKEIPVLRQELKKVFLNQQLIEQGRIFPKGVLIHGN